MSFQIAVLLLVLLVAVPFGLVAIWGRAFLYYPTRLDAAGLQALASQPGWRVDRLRTTTGEEIVGLVHPPADRTAPWVVFFGGNAMGLSAGQTILEMLAADADWGLALWAYRGYDQSGGKPTQSALCADAEMQMAHLTDAYGVQPARMVVAGQSLGTGVAAHVTAWLADRAAAPPAGLVWLSPYTSIARVFDDIVPLVPVGWVTPDPFATDRILDRIPGPVLIVHGTNDTLIRFRHGEKLAWALGRRAELYPVDGGDHNSLWGDGPAVRRMHDFIITHTQ